MGPGPVTVVMVSIRPDAHPQNMEVSVMNESFIRLSGWLAYANAVLSIAGFVTLVGFFIIGGILGPVNDAISVLWALTFVPLLLLLYQLNRPVNQPVSLAVAIAGIAAALGFALLQSLLVLGIVRFEQTFMAVVTLGSIIGLAILIGGLMARGGQTLPSGLTWMFIAYGLGYALSALGIWLGGQEHPLAASGYLIGAIAGPIWAIWLGRLLLNGAKVTATGLDIGGSL